MAVGAWNVAAGAWNMAVGAWNVAAGEDIRVLDMTGRGEPALPRHDFWLFDEATVVELLYHPDGTQAGRELVRDPDLTAYLGWRDATWNPAIPFRDYWPNMATSRV